MVFSKKHIAIEWGSNMIVPIVLNFDMNTQYTKQNSRAAFVRLREHLYQYGVLLKSKHYDPTSQFTQLRQQSDMAISDLVRNIVDEMPVSELPDWDGQIDTLNTSINCPFVACGANKDALNAQNIEHVDWHNIDTAPSIERIKQSRKLSRMRKGDSRQGIWDTLFAPIYTYIPINRIEIIDRYLLTNVIQNKSNQPNKSDQLQEFLNLVNQSNSYSTKKKSIVIYSSKNEIDINDIRNYFQNNLVPLCHQLPCISKICMFVCRNHDFTNHYHDRYLISSLKDKLYYVHKLGIGLELFAENTLSRSQECSLAVHTRDTIDQYRDMLNTIERNSIIKLEEFIQHA